MEEEDNRMTGEGDFYDENKSSAWRGVGTRRTEEGEGVAMEEHSARCGYIFHPLPIFIFNIYPSI